MDRDGGAGTCDQQNDKPIVSMAIVETEKYKTAAAKGVGDPVLQKALANLQERFGRGTAAAYLELPEGPGLRRRAHDIRMETIERLDTVLKDLSANVEKNGGHVYFADDDQEAVGYARQVARKHGVEQVVKGKSMVTEEIGLNEAFLSAGIQVTETDLGEFIVQLAAEHPSHIIAPAIHKTRHDIGQLFSRELGIPYTDDPPTLTQAARKTLRRKFLSADMGVSGCNIACAETGHITTVSNEGNIRMSSTLPRIYMVFMGMERVTSRLEDHEILMRLLSLGAAVQQFGTYVSYMGGPRHPEDTDGPEAFHLVIVDNGRSRILADNDFREMLCCIRCAACLNVCPVYGKIGGHAYGYPYSGPVGAVVTPLLVGINRAKDLCLGETLCGACQDACPVNIDIPRMLLKLREKLAYGDPAWEVSSTSKTERVLFNAWSKLIQNRTAYEQFIRLAGHLQRQWMPKARAQRFFPMPVRGWIAGRELKLPARETFIGHWRRIQRDRG